MADDVMLVVLGVLQNALDRAAYILKAPARALQAFDWRAG